MPTKKEDKSHTRTKTISHEAAKRNLMHIKNYKLLEEIGRGGMGTVYLAEQKKPMRRKVALKIIKAGMDSREVVARFESEQQALALMEHPNIAQVHDSGQTEQGHPYFVMEYVPGLPITEFCDKHKITTLERLKLFQKVCDAIQHAHFKGVVHRDLKPSNILVILKGDQHVPKIIDFGIAKALTGQGLTEKTLHTIHGAAIGTPIYMSPEQAELTGYDIDTRTDIYSLGILLYELLVGTTPFSEEELERAGLVEILRVIREDDPPKPSIRFNSLGDTSAEIANKRGANEIDMRKQLKGDLDWIIMRALEKDRRRRYGSAAEFAKDIDRYLNKEPIQAHPPSFVYKIKKYVRRQKAASFAIISILLLIIVFSSWNIWERQKAEVSLKESYYNFAVALKEKAKSHAENNEWSLTKLFTVNSLYFQMLSGRFLSMGDIYFPIGYQNLELKSRFFYSFRYKASGLGLGEHSFSANGRYLASLSEPHGRIDIHELSTGKKINSLKGLYIHGLTAFQAIGQISVSPNGEHLAVVHRDNTIRILDFWNNQEISTLKHNAELINSICYSPNGKYLGSRLRDGIKVWDVQSGLEVFSTRVHENSSVSFPIRFSPDGKYIAADGGLQDVKIYDVMQDQEIVTIKGHKGWISSVCFSPNGKYIVTGGRDKTIRVWEMSNGKAINIIKVKASKPIISVDLSNDGKYILSSYSFEEYVDIFEMKTGNLVNVLKGSYGYFVPNLTDKSYLNFFIKFLRLK